MLTKNQPQPLAKDIEREKKDIIHCLGEAISEIDKVTELDNAIAEIRSYMNGCNLCGSQDFISLVNKLIDRTLYIRPVVMKVIRWQMWSICEMVRKINQPYKDGDFEKTVAKEIKYLKEITQVNNT